MVKTSFIATVFCLLSLSTGSNTLGSPANAYESVRDDEHEIGAPHAKRKVRWFSHGEEIINGTELYGFDTSPQYSADNPDHTTTYAAYDPTPSGGVTAMTAVNESSFVVFAADSTEDEFDFSCRYSLSSSPEINSNGTSYVGVRYTPYLPPNCEICSDSRTLGTANGVWHLASGASPTIGTGILLYRSNSTGSFSTWDGYQYLSDFQNNPNLRIAFGPNLYVQIAILYEVHNWDNGWWLWQNNWYYHNIGIYTFHTTSL